MHEDLRLAVPSVGEGGLDSERSGHFGHCDCFTLIDLSDGEVAAVSTVVNPPHSEGGCMTSVGLLASHGVDALIVAGMGARPLSGFQAANITVYFDNETPMVADVVNRFTDAGLPAMDPDQTCKGH